MMIECLKSISFQTADFSSSHTCIQSQNNNNLMLQRIGLHKIQQMTRLFFVQVKHFLIMLILISVLL